MLTLELEKVISDFNTTFIHLEDNKEFVDYSKNHVNVVYGQYKGKIINNHYFYFLVYGTVAIYKGKEIIRIYYSKGDMIHFEKNEKMMITSKKCVFLKVSKEDAQYLFDHFKEQLLPYLTIQLKNEIYTYKSLSSLKTIRNTRDRMKQGFIYFPNLLVNEYGLTQSVIANYFSISRQSFNEQLQSIYLDECFTDLFKQ